MGKFASRDSTGTPVAWGDITGKPSTFDPNPHDNAAHSTAYAPINNTALTGTFSSTRSINGEHILLATNTYPGTAIQSTIGFGFNTAAADPDTLCKIQAIIANRGSGTQEAYLAFLTSSGGSLTEKMRLSQGLHIGGTSDPGDNNLLVDGNATAGAFKTADFTIVQSGTDLLINYGATNILKISSAGYLRMKDEVEPFASLV